MLLNLSHLHLLLLVLELYRSSTQSSFRDRRAELHLLWSGHLDLLTHSAFPLLLFLMQPRLLILPFTHTFACAFTEFTFSLHLPPSPNRSFNRSETRSFLRKSWSKYYWQNKQSVAERGNAATGRNKGRTVGEREREVKVGGDSNRTTEGYRGEWRQKVEEIRKSWIILGLVTVRRQGAEAKIAPSWSAEGSSLGCRSVYESCLLCVCVEDLAALMKNRGLWRRMNKWRWIGSVVRRQEGEGKDKECRMSAWAKGSSHQNSFSKRCTVFWFGTWTFGSQTSAQNCLVMKRRGRSELYRVESGMGLWIVKWRMKEWCGPFGGVKNSVCTVLCTVQSNCMFSRPVQQCSLSFSASLPLRSFPFLFHLCLCFSSSLYAWLIQFWEKNCMSVCSVRVLFLCMEMGNSFSSLSAAVLWRS